MYPNFSAKIFYRSLVPKKFYKSCKMKFLDAVQFCSRDFKVDLSVRFCTSWYKLSLTSQIKWPNITCNSFRAFSGNRACLI